MHIINLFLENKSKSKLKLKHKYQHNWKESHLKCQPSTTEPIKSGMNSKGQIDNKIKIYFVDTHILFTDLTALLLCLLSQIGNCVLGWLCFTFCNTNVEFAIR